LETQSSDITPWNRNVRLFAMYRVFFNMRFYYPVFALFYLDAGVSIEQFAVLQAIWSLSIVAFEVPSGIVADLIGRTKTLRLGAFLAVIEMLVFALSTTFWGFALNRVLSGFNDSLASGADSALLYDSLKEAGRQDQYKEALGRAQYQTLIFGSVSAVSGSLLYTIHMRLPIWFTAGCMLVTFVGSLFFRETPRLKQKATIATEWSMFRNSLKIISDSKEIVFLILFAFLVDSSIRIAMVHNSIYFQEILIPVAWFGAISVGIHLVASIVSKNAYRIDTALGFNGSALVVGGLALASFAGMSAMVPFMGVVFPLALAPCMFFVTVNVEGEINSRIPSDFRATILSIKNICLNMGFAAGMILFDRMADKSLSHSFWALTAVFLVGELLLFLAGRKVRIDSKKLETERN